MTQKKKKRKKKLVLTFWIVFTSHKLSQKPESDSTLNESNEQLSALLRSVEEKNATAGGQLE